MKKGKRHYFLVGFGIGAVLAVGLAIAAYSAAKYYRTGEGLGYSKAMARGLLKNLGAAEWQVKRFKNGGLDEKIEVIKELLVAKRDNLPWVKKEKRVPLWKKGGKIPAFRIETASSLDRIFKDGMSLEAPVTAEAAHLSMARNEYEGFQILVTAGNAGLKNLDVVIPGFTDKEGKVAVSPSYVSWRIVGYVPTQRPYYSVKFVGDWPDPLLPAQSFDVPAGVTQPLWITVYVPDGTPAGTYQANIKVYASGRLLKEVPVSLKVFGFSLLREGHLRTAFDFYPQTTHFRYPQGANESDDRYQARIGDINEKYIVDMILHRLDPILNIDPMSEWDLGRLERYMALGLDNFGIGSRNGTNGNNWPEKDDEIEALAPLYEQYGSRLAIEKLLPFHYIYMWDESGMGDPRVAKIAAMIHRGDRRLKNMVCYHGFWDPERYPGWGDDIDIWCFQIDSFDQAKMDELKRLGKEIWMYVSSPAGTASPNLVIDTDTIDYRIVPWLCWKYDIKGFLYWCVNWWPYVDPFKDTNNTQWGQNGNGLLYYPGPEGPMASIRLEVLRDGLEDYEYLYLLKVIAEAVEAKGPNSQEQGLLGEAEKLLQVDSPIADSMTRFTKDSKAFLERRDKIGEAIEKLGGVLKAGGL